MGTNNACVIFLVVVFAVYTVFGSPFVVIRGDETGRPSRPLLGTAEKVCTWGPSYWCTNITTAKGCGAVRHCIQTVWEHQTLPADNDDICTICKDMVKQARDQLESNQTQEELKEVFEGSCNLIPLKPVAEGCDKLVDEFIPELVETLASQMNPQMVCSVAGLCNNAEIDRMLAAAGKLTRVSLKKTDLSPAVIHTEGASECDTCSRSLSKMEKKFKAVDHDDMMVNFVQLCRNQGSYSDACALGIVKHFNTIYSGVQKYLASDETCQLVKMCSKDSKQKTRVNVEIVNESSLGVVPVGDDMTCQFCEKMIQHLRDILVANTTESEFEQVMEGLCKQTGKYKDECLSIVSEYYGMIYNFLVNHLDDKEICSLAGMCPQPGKNLTPIWPMLPADMINEGKLIGTDEAESMKDTLVHISPDSAKVKFSDPATVQLPIERMVPMLVNVGSNKQACEFCEYFLHFVQTQLGDVKTEEKVKEAVESACDRLPKSINAQCRDFVDQYGNAFIAILIQEIDPSIICPGMGFCPSRGQIVMVGGQDNYEDKPGCPLCLLAVTQLDAMIKNNKTEANIRSALEGLCIHLPESLVPECKTFVDTYSQELIEMLIADFTPQEVCVYIKLCDPDKPSHSSSLASGDISTNEIPQYENGKLEKPIVKDSPQCVVCEFIMSRLEGMLKTNATEEEIKSAVHSICNHLPKTVGPQCNKFVDQYADLVIQILVNSMSPKDVCVSLNVCDPNKVNTHQVTLTLLQHHAKKSVEECALCEGVVQALDTYLKDPNVEHKIDELLERACQVLPAKQYGQCRRFIQVYGPSIQNILAQIPGATHLICGKIGACMKAGTVDLIGGQKCTWGPSYWCQSERHATDCGAGTLQHCQERVWKGVRPQPQQ